ncbi:MAG: hypothetical protein MZV63_47005 [Marinilabiliales bacterium]|nr:hypothetical protein [Marinilabiliales bacterium]
MLWKRRRRRRPSVRNRPEGFGWIRLRGALSGVAAGDVQIVVQPAAAGGVDELDVPGHFPDEASDRPGFLVDLEFQQAVLQRRGHRFPDERRDRIARPDPVPGRPEGGHGPGQHGQVSVFQPLGWLGMAEFVENEIAGRAQRFRDPDNFHPGEARRIEDVDRVGRSA